MTTRQYYLLGQSGRYRRQAWQDMSPEEQANEVVLREALLSWCQSLAGKHHPWGWIEKVEILDLPGIPGPTAVEVSFRWPADPNERDDSLMSTFPLALSRERRRLELLRANAQPTVFP